MMLLVVLFVVVRLLCCYYYSELLLTTTNTVLLVVESIGSIVGTAANSAALVAAPFGLTVLACCGHRLLPWQLSVLPAGMVPGLMPWCTYFFWLELCSAIVCHFEVCVVVIHVRQQSSFFRAGHWLPQSVSITWYTVVKISALDCISILAEHCSANRPPRLVRGGRSRHRWRRKNTHFRFISHHSRGSKV